MKMTLVVRLHPSKDIMGPPLFSSCLLIIELLLAYPAIKKGFYSMYTVAYKVWGAFKEGLLCTCSSCACCITSSTVAYKCCIAEN